MYPGFEPGSEANPTDWPAWITGSPTVATSLQYLFGEEFFQYFVFTPAWTDADFNAKTDLTQSDAKMAPILNSTNPDLRRFLRHGGKLIHYVGWADSAIPPKNTLNYYNSVLLLGSGGGYDRSKLAALQNSYRLFMVPGMAHCGGGPGANVFGQPDSADTAQTTDPEHNVVMALDRWVERGVAPNYLIATKYANDIPADGIAFQRPLCPYPLVSRYRGSGNVNSARSFTCAEDNDAFAGDLARAIKYLITNWPVLFNPRNG